MTCHKHSKRLKNAETAAEFQKILDEDRETRIKLRVQAMERNRFDAVINKYGFDFCMRLGAYVREKASKK